MKPLISDLYILNGNITLFLGTHSAQFKEDILHSSLLGQLLADEMPDAWLSTYTNAMGRTYWALNNIKISLHKKKPASLLDISSTALTDILQREQLQQLSTSLSAIAQLPDDSHARKALTNRLQSQNTPIDDDDGTFTMNTLLTIVCENKKILSLQVLLKTTRALDITFLEHVISEQLIVGEVKTNLWTASLLEDKYVKIRERVLSKLGSTCQTHLFHINT
ncbi:hypothetical protein [Pseudomonas sp. C2B4]|uniref:hypothetical protein n=1 Tax=Pseudomonas sp. C2B4 TaxID=2735270 RepID=UPI001585EC60|nr:hypothetical protein [Pseudomonas sp. C2B4]NUU34127.1 hypothetical protein [Pseudomonas sp. C2B4]